MRPCTPSARTQLVKRLAQSAALRPGCNAELRSAQAIRQVRCRRIIKKLYPAT